MTTLGRGLLEILIGLAVGSLAAVVVWTIGTRKNRRKS